MKVIDFMSSLFKMFNLRVQENGYRSLKFYLPEDFNTMSETNIGGEVDYTNYVDRTSSVGNKVEKFKN